MKRPSTTKRIRRHNARELLGAATTLARESVRMAAARGGGEPRRDRLRRALCTIAERLALDHEDLERMLAEVHCGHRRDAWIVELTTPLDPRPTQRSEPREDEAR